MTLGPHLFNETEPPMITVELSPVGTGPLDDMRDLKVRIKPVGKKSIHVKAIVGRYSPEWSVFVALAHFMRDVEQLTVPPTTEILRHMLKAHVDRAVEPF